MENHHKDIEKQVYAEALRKAAHDYEELIREFSILRLLNDSIQTGLGFNEICQKLVQFITEMMNVENASIMVFDPERAELRLLAAKSMLEEKSALYPDSDWQGKTFKVGEGIAGKAVSEKKIILINDTLRDPRFVENRLQKVQIRSILSIPLIHEDRVHGVLNISNSEPGAFTPRKQHALSIIASTASVALSYANTVEQLRRVNTEMENRNKELGAVVALSELLHSTLELNAVLEDSLETVLEAFDAAGAAIFLAEGADSALKLKSCSARNAHDVSPECLSINERFGKEVILSRKPVIRPASPDKGAKEGGGASAHAGFVCFPICAAQHCMGVLTLIGLKKGEPAEPGKKLLVSFCNQIGMAIHNCTLIGRLRDNIQELQETRRKLVQSDKLALLGEMLSGVAHEINNPLAAIQGYSELLLNQETLSPQQNKMLQKVILCVDRTRKIVQGLLSFARKTELQKQAVNIHELLERALEHREHDLRFHSIEIVKDFARCEPIALVDPNQIEQVFLNLINNAFDSMAGAGKGVLSLATRLIDATSVEVAFVDTGKGVPEQDRQKIFEPFFTTKEVGKGTGLGLSVSYGIVQEHKGALYLDESYREGARFVVRLPLAIDAPGQPEPYAKGMNDPAQQKGKVLVVDDEDVVLDFMQAALTGEGFTVDCASGGEQAYALIKNSFYDLIISDIKMPGTLDGRRLFLLCRQENPRIAERFIFISGDIVETETSRFLEQSGRPFLLKPFPIKELRYIVNKTLRQISRGQGSLN